VWAARRTSAGTTGFGQPRTLSAPGTGISGIASTSSPVWCSQARASGAMYPNQFPFLSWDSPTDSNSRPGGSPCERTRSRPHVPSRVSRMHCRWPTSFRSVGGRRTGSSALSSIATAAVSAEIDHGSGPGFVDPDSVAPVPSTSSSPGP
jgi:hypothetical protein